MLLDDDKPDFFEEEDEETKTSDSRNISFTTDSEKSTTDTSAVKPVKPRRRHRFARFMAWTLFICLVVLGVTFYLRYLNPYATEATVTGYITQIEKRGIVCKTYEGEMISEASLTDTTRLYSRDFNFSVPNDSLAAILRAYQGSGRPVKLTFERYYATLPWRGASLNVVTDVEVP